MLRAPELGGPHMLHRCTFDGCAETVEAPETFMLPPDGWVLFQVWGLGIPDGLYCAGHANAIELIVPELDELQGSTVVRD